MLGHVEAPQGLESHENHEFKPDNDDPEDEEEGEDAYDMEALLGEEASKADQGLPEM